MLLQQFKGRTYGRRRYHDRFLWIPSKGKRNFDTYHKIRVGLLCGINRTSFDLKVILCLGEHLIHFSFFWQSKTMLHCWVTPFYLFKITCRQLKNGVSPFTSIFISPHFSASFKNTHYLPGHVCPPCFFIFEIEAKLL